MYIAFWRRFGICVAGLVLNGATDGVKVFTTVVLLISFHFTQRYIQHVSLFRLGQRCALKSRLTSTGEVINARLQRAETSDGDGEAWVSSGDKPSVVMPLQQPRVSSYLVSSANG